MDFTSDPYVLSTVAEGRELLDVVPKLDKPWYRYPHLLKLNLLLLAPILAQVVSGYDGSMMNGLQDVAVWQSYFNYPLGQRLGTMNNATTIGTLVATPFTSYVTDFLGRRRTLILGCFVILIGAAIQGAAQNFGMFIGGRILLGVGSCISSVAAGPWLIECAYPAQRASVTSFLLASWSFGSFLAALVTWGSFNGSLVNSTWSWRVPSILQGFLPLVQICIAFFAPESPRWLVSKGRHREARHFFTKYHAAGDENHLIVSYQMAEIEATLEEEKVQKISSWVEWVKTSAMRHRFFIVLIIPMMLQFEGNALISYYLHIILENIGITSSTEQLKINLGNTIFSLVCAVIFASCADKFRRRTFFLSGLISMLVCYIIWTVLSAIDEEHNNMSRGLSIGVILFIYLYSGVNNICAVIGTPYVMEITPYSLRAKAATIYQVTGNVAGFYNNYVNPIAMVAITWKYYIVWICMLGVWIVMVYFVFPETSGHSLEEVDEVFGGGLNSGRDAIKSQAAKKSLEKRGASIVTNTLHLNEQVENTSL